MKKIKSSLYARYFAEACNKWRDPSPRLRRNIAEVASRWWRCIRLDRPWNKTPDLRHFLRCLKPLRQAAGFLRLVCHLQATGGSPNSTPEKRLRTRSADSSTAEPVPENEAVKVASPEREKSPVDVVTAEEEVAVRGEVVSSGGEKAEEPVSIIQKGRKLRGSTKSSSPERMKSSDTKLSAESKPLPADNEAPKNSENLQHQSFPKPKTLPENNASHDKEELHKKKAEESSQSTEKMEDPIISKKRRRKRKVKDYPWGQIKKKKKKITDVSRNLK